MNKYQLRYTKWNAKNRNPSHKIYIFDSENDLLAAADEGMCKVLDDNPNHELLFRSIELTNSKEVYEEMTRETVASV